MADSPSTRRYDTGLVLHQIAQTVREIATEMAADADENRARAYVRANHSGKVRRIDTPGTSREVDHLADLFVHWLVERADGDTPDESISLALSATEDREGSPLARDLIEYVTAYCDGSMSEDDWYRRLKKPRGSGRPRRRAQPPAEPANAIPVSAAAGTLQAMVDKASPPLDARSAWEAFKAFAARPIVADGGERLQSDDLLFQSDRGSVDIVRQFTIQDSDGDYDRLEQLHLTLSFPNPNSSVDADHLWSTTGSHADWFAEVEGTPGFHDLMGAQPPIDAQVWQERV
jgi:hypothetical protein